MYRIIICKTFDNFIDYKIPPFFTPFPNANTIFYNIKQLPFTIRILNPSLRI